MKRRDSRNEKIAFLKAVLEGKANIKSLLPPINRIWQRDPVDPDIWHCSEGELMRRTDEKLIDKLEGRDVLNILIISHGIPPIAHSEEEIVD